MMYPMEALWHNLKRTTIAKSLFCTVLVFKDGIFIHLKPFDLYMC